LKGRRRAASARGDNFQGGSKTGAKAESVNALRWFKVDRLNRISLVVFEELAE